MYKSNFVGEEKLNLHNGEVCEYSYGIDSGSNYRSRTLTLTLTLTLTNRNPNPNLNPNRNPTVGRVRVLLYTYAKPSSINIAFPFKVYAPPVEDLSQVFQMGSMIFKWNNIWSSSIWNSHPSDIPVV